MQKKEYSASAVKQSFWFMEFRKVVSLRSEGKSWTDIKRLSEEENIFGATTPARAHQIWKTTTERVASLDDSFYPVFQEGDVATQKMFALVAAMANDTLFAEFVYEVIREKMIIGVNEYRAADVRIFFKNKQQQNEKAAKWTEQTIGRLSRCYRTMLFEAGLTDKAIDTRRILKPILDPAIEKWLMDNDMEYCVKALTGVR